MATSEGIGVLQLECPQSHPVGRILKGAPHQSSQYDPGAAGGPREFWPQEDADGRFKRHCTRCDKQVGESASALQSKLSELIFNETETHATATLSYL